MREGMKGELPRTLKGLKERVEAVAHEKQMAEPHTIFAAQRASCECCQFRASPDLFDRGLLLDSIEIADDH